MAWSTPTSRSSGYKVTAAVWNQDVVDNPIALRGGAIAITSQGANELIFASSSSQLSRSAELTYATRTLTVGGSSSGNKTLRLGGSPSGNDAAFVELIGSNSAINWRVDANAVGGKLTFTPSTAGGGSTFTTQIWEVNNSGNVIQSGSLTIAAGGNVTWGVWTPTLTNGTNVAGSTNHEGQYLRVGNTVTCSVKIEVDPTLAASATDLQISLPVASNFGDEHDCVGVGCNEQFTQSGRIRGDATNDRAEYLFVSASANNVSHGLVFTYQVI